MNTAVVSSEAVELLSRITEQKLSQKDLTPPVIFLGALITVLLGVILVDGTVTDEEKQRWQKTINKFIFSQYMRQLSQSISKGVRQNQTYKKVNDLLTLTAALSESERLLLIAFGYEMSAADGEIDLRELKYLELIANQLNINPQHLAVLNTKFNHQGAIEPTALDEVHYLLNPARFHSLDIVFVKAASDMLAALPTKSEPKATQRHNATAYSQLEKFQKNRRQLEIICNHIKQVIQDCAKRNFVSNTLINEIEKLSKKIQDQRFRLAVVGEFSQGKSTLLNALLGEEIQPVRAIPCSGTVSVLKYGMQKRVVCRYKDGREENIPFERYQEKAAISEEAALGSLSDELIESEIAEIIFEHPDLELCRSGVEIVDSPGLNEHPERTAIIQQLLKGTDAVIFLVNASRPLTQGERELILDLKIKLNGGKEDKPAENFFLVVNFMDLLRREKDRQDVKQRIEKFVYGQNIIKCENRVHFISAQAALDSILDGNEDEYLKTFRYFTKSIEKFLTNERGYIKIKGYVTELECFIQAALDGLIQTDNALDGNVKISDTEKQKILEQIGEATGRDVKIRIFADKLVEQVAEQANQSWNQCVEELGDRIAEKSTYWSSEHSHIWSQDKLIRDYANQFIRDLSKELDDWANQKLWNLIVKINIEVLDTEICNEIEEIRKGFQLFDQRLNTSLVNQFNNIAFAGELRGIGTSGLGIASSINPDISGAGGFFSGLGAGGLVAAALVVFTGLGIIPVILGGLAAAAGGSFGFGLLDVDGIHTQIKQKVFDLGFEKFQESLEEIFEKINERIALAFNERVEAANRVIEQAVRLSENFLEQQEKFHKETLEQHQIGKAFISQKRQELEQVQNDIEEILNQSAG